MDAIHGADIDAGGVLDADARLSNDVGYTAPPRLGGRNAPFEDDDIAFEPGLAGEAKARIFDRMPAALTDEVLAFVATHGAEPANARNDFHRAVCTFAVLRAPHRPIKAVSCDGVQHGLALRSFDFDANWFNANTGHAGILSCGTVGRCARRESGVEH